MLVLFKEVFLLMITNKLTRHRCWLVQSGISKNNNEEITGINSIIDLNYMGSAEFEWNALPQSTQRMLTNIEFYDVFTFPQYVNGNGEELMVYAPRMFIEHIAEIVENLANGSLNGNLKEWCNLSDYLKGKERAYKHANFWWDIENDFYIFFGKEKKELVLEAQRAMRERSLDQVEVGNWDELSEYYSIANQDLNDEAKEFLRPKKSKLTRRLVKVLKTKLELDSKK